MIVMRVHHTSVHVPALILHLRLKKSDLGRHIWCDIQVDMLKQIVADETQVPPAYQFWMLVSGVDSEGPFAQLLDGMEHLFELDYGGARRLIPFGAGCQAALLPPAVLNLTFRVHCFHAAASLPTETRILSQQSLQFGLRSVQDDAETLYYSSDDNCLHSPREPERSPHSLPSVLSVSSVQSAPGDAEEDTVSEEQSTVSERSLAMGRGRGYR